MSVDERRGVALALAGLDDVGSARLRALLAAGPPWEVWQAVRSGDPPVPATPELAQKWAAQAASVDPEDVLAHHVAANVGVVTFGEDGYPACLTADRAPPGLLVWRGDLSILGGVSAGIVGTRRCTRYGREVARSLGRDLAVAGVAVVSGLALGVDGAAHEGVLGGSEAGGRPIGVVAGGLDRFSPRRHRPLAAEVAATGVLLTETPLGTEPQPWRFPSRNRVIAALSSVLVVVESDRAGGSMHTVRQADDRGRTVMAVPGPVTSAASRGTNQLLAEGCPPCRDAVDVLVALGLSDPTGATSLPAGSGNLPLSSAASQTLAAMEWQPISFDALLTRTRLPIASLALALEELQHVGHVVAIHGCFERTGRPS